MKLRIDLSCAQCGSNRIDIPAQAGDDSPVICEECGHVLGSLGDVKIRVEQAVLGGGTVNHSNAGADGSRRAEEQE